MPKTRASARRCGRMRARCSPRSSSADRRSSATWRPSAASIATRSDTPSARWWHRVWPPLTVSRGCARCCRRTLPPTATGRGQFSGRWTTTSAPEVGGREQAVEIQAWGLLRRYGVIFRRLLTREPHVAPWRELTRIYRRLEARGEIRGGRFVSGMTGEQFALPDAIDRLREVRRTAPDGRLLTITTADPLNLVGIITPGERVRTAARNTLVYRDGIALAVMEGDFTRPLVPMDAETSHAIAPVGQKRRAGAQPVAEIGTWGRRWDIGVFLSSPISYLHLLSILPPSDQPLAHPM